MLHGVTVLVCERSAEDAAEVGVVVPSRVHDPRFGTNSPAPFQKSSGTQMLSAERYLWQPSLVTAEAAGGILSGDSGRVVLADAGDYILDAAAAEAVVAWSSIGSAQVVGMPEVLAAAGSGKGSDVEKLCAALAGKSGCSALHLQNAKLLRASDVWHYRHVCNAAASNGPVCSAVDKICAPPACKGVVMGSISRDGSAVIGGQSVVLRSIIGERVAIGEGAVVSDCILRPGLIIPCDAFLHTVPLTTGNFVTLAFQVGEDPAAQVSDAYAARLPKFGMLGVPPRLWDAPLFEVAETREESACHAVLLMTQRNIGAPGSDFRQACISMQEAFALEDHAHVTVWEHELRQKYASAAAAGADWRVLMALAPWADTEPLHPWLEQALHCKSAPMS